MSINPNANNTLTTVPNTLTIFVNTRIRNFRNFKYEPSMSVPGEKSQVVCFEPMIQLSKSIINYIPPQYPKEELYTQFFRRNEFNSLLARTLNQFPVIRAKDLLSAKYQGIVDNNIRSILNTLFKNGAPFYLNGKRFTVQSFDWIDGDWQIDTKMFERQFMLRTQYSLLPYTSAPFIPSPNIAIGNQELSNIPSQAIKGNVNLKSSKISKAVTISTGTGGLPSTLPIATPVPSGPLGPSGPSVPLAPAVPLAPTSQPTLPPPTYSNPTTAAAIGAVSKALSAATASAQTSIKSGSLETPTEALRRNFLGLYEEGLRKDLINPGKTASINAMISQINHWNVQVNNENGDCFFDALANILNSQDISRNPNDPNIVRPYRRLLSANPAEVMVPLDPNTYYPYDIRKLRKALVDYLDDFPNIFDNYIDVAINSMTANPGDNTWNFLKDILTDNNPFSPTNGQFYNTANITPAMKQQIKNRMKIPADRALQSPGETVPGTSPYYWADLMAIQCFEDIFHMKICIINAAPKAQFSNGTKVKFISTGQLAMVVDSNNGTVETDDYNRLNEPESNFDPGYDDERYSVNCLNTEIHDKYTNDGYRVTKTGTSITHFAFMVYSGNHYESIYLELPRKNKYLFNPALDVPSYIKYLIFLDCYRFLSAADKPTSAFGKLTGNLGFGEILSQLEQITDEKIADKNKKIRTNRKMQNGGYQAGGAVTDPQFRNLATKYMQDSSQFSFYDSKLGYYIVVDLELYPGDSINMARSVALGCSDKYNKIWGSLADMVGIPFQPGELYVPNDVPAPSPPPQKEDTKKDDKTETQKGGRRHRKKTTRRRRS